MAKTLRHLTIGRLLFLPVPHCPWSYLGMDFIRDLPPSDGHTYVLVVVDRFSKAWCLVPLKGLPTAMETAEILFNHVFCNFGLPKDIVSDRGPQFISSVRRSFFALLGVTVSLSCEYHPLRNGKTECKSSHFHRTFCHGHQDFWNWSLAWAEYAQNSLQQSNRLTWLSAPLFPLSGEQSEAPSVTHWFQESERVRDKAHHHLQWAVIRLTLSRMREAFRQQEEQHTVSVFVFFFSH